MRLALAVALALAAPALAAPALAEDDHLSEAEGLRAVHAWTRATAGDTAHVFVELENTGTEAQTLLGGRAEIAETVRLVGYQAKGGTAAYVPLPQMPLAPGQDLALSPEGLALELAGLGTALEEGAGFAMHLVFAGFEMEIAVAVEAAGARQHSHAGHQH